MKHLYFILLSFLSISCNFTENSRKLIKLNKVDSVIFENTVTNQSFVDKPYFYYRDSGYYCVNYTDNPSYYQINEYGKVAKITKLNMGKPYNMMFIHDSLVISYPSEIEIMHKNTSSIFQFDNNLIDSYYVYSLKGYTSSFFHKNHYYLYLIPKREKKRYFNVYEFEIKNNKLNLIKPIIPFPQEFRDSFYYSYFANFDFDNKDNIYYCFSDYNYIYKINKTKNSVDSLNLTNIVNGFHKTPFPKKQFYNVEFINKSFITEPMILSLRYDKYRNCIHLFVKAGQNIVNSQGAVNERENADITWLILDTNLKVISKTLLPNNTYTEFSNILITPKGIGIKLKNYDYDKIHFDIFNF